MQRLEEGQCISMETIEKIKTEVKRKIEEDEFARSVYRREEKDKGSADMCTGSIMAYRKVLMIIDNYVRSETGMPCEDCISRQAVLGKAIDYGSNTYLIPVNSVKALPPVTPQETKTWQFAEWVASEIFDDNWEYNKDAFAELACRKLEKLGILGIVRVKGDEWELVGPQGSEVKE